jgi:rhamnosyltransferase subunit B
MHVIMTPVGSAGDVLPFVALGRRLLERGHEVVLLTNEYFRELVEGSGVSFGSVGSKARYSAAMDDPDLWHPSRGAQVVIQQMVAQTSEMYHAVMERVRPGESVLLSSPGATGAHLVQEKMNLPMATFFLQPNTLFGIHGLWVTASMTRLDWTPVWLRRGLFLLSGRLVLDRIVRRPVNEIRARIGLPAAGSWMSAWQGEPSLEIGLFPEWFAPYRRDSSNRVRLTGFVSYSGEDVRKTPNELADFLALDSPPLVFTAGTANKQAHKFFAAAVQATQRVGRRAVLLTPFRDQVPTELPDSVIQIDYAPLSDFLPRTAAMVHHGGVGTLAQALAAGIPQLIVPYGLDQPANAIRVSDLGAGDYLSFKKVNERELSEKLTSLLKSQEMRRVARGYAEKIACQDALSETCDLVETLQMASPQRA